MAILDGNSMIWVQKATPRPQKTKLHTINLINLLSASDMTAILLSVLGQPGLYDSSSGDILWIQDNTKNGGGVNVVTDSTHVENSITKGVRYGQLY